MLTPPCVFACMRPPVQMWTGVHQPRPWPTTRPWPTRCTSVEWRTTSRTSGTKHEHSCICMCGAFLCVISPSGSGWCHQLTAAILNKVGWTTTVCYFTVGIQGYGKCTKKSHLVQLKAVLKFNHMNLMLFLCLHMFGVFTLWRLARTVAQCCLWGLISDHVSLGCSHGTKPSRGLKSIW